MPKTVKLVTVEKGGLVRLSQDELTRLNVNVGDYLNVEEVGDRCLHFYKAEPPEQDLVISVP
jgi:hypothetical protein